MHLEQRQRAQDWLKQHGFEHALFSAPATVTWLTGLAPAVQVGPSPFAGGPPLVWYAGGTFTLVVPDSLAEAAGRAGCLVVTYPAYAYETPVASVAQLAAIVRGLTDNARGRLGAEQHALPAHLWPAGAVPLDGQLDDLRLVKTAAELAVLRRNFALTDIGHAAGRRAVRVGQREIDVWTAVQSAIEQAAGERVVLGNDCVVGGRENNSGGWPGDLPLRAGDALILDLGTRVGGYWSDSCGTYFADAPTDRQAAVYRVVREALELAVALIRPGAVAAAIDAEVRAFIRAAGYPVYAHHTGHGVGVTAHEEVRITPYNQRALAAGMVLMLEPGVYFPGEFGVRLEDAVLVTAAGAEVLTHHAKTLP